MREFVGGAAPGRHADTGQRLKGFAPGFEDRAYRALFESAAAVLDSAPETFAIAGFSMGGYVAMEVLRQAPERVTRLGSVSTPSRSSPC